jgi:hypothetical protein
MPDARLAHINHRYAAAGKPIKRCVLSAHACNMILDDTARCVNAVRGGGGGAPPPGGGGGGGPTPSLGTPLPLVGVIGN